jgi:hypothetical protein
MTTATIKAIDKCSAQCWKTSGSVGSKYFKKNAAIKIIPKIRKGTAA